MVEVDPSCIPAGIAQLDAIFERKGREHAMAAAILGASERFEEDMTEQRRDERAQVAVDRQAGRRNPASKKARARARRSRSQ